MLSAQGLFGAATLGVALLATPLQAATVVAPTEYAASDAPAAQFGILGNPSNSDSSFQFVVAASQLTGLVPGAVISSIGFRFAGSPFTTPVGPASFSRYDIQIGQAANPVTALSSNFASNLGTDTILARSGALTIPADSFDDLAGEGPNAFYDLAFTTPYAYAGGDLAVTIRYVPVIGNPGIALDAFAPNAAVNTVFAFGNASATTGVVGAVNAPVTRFTFAVAAVPEPATWAMLIVGFGLVGGSLRRRAQDMAKIA